MPVNFNPCDWFSGGSSGNGGSNVDLSGVYARLDKVETDILTLNGTINLYNIRLNNLEAVAVKRGTTFPTSATQGDLFVKTDVNPVALYVYSYGNWVQVVGSGNGGGGTLEGTTLNEPLNIQQTAPLLNEANNELRTWMWNDPLTNPNPVGYIRWVDSTMNGGNNNEVRLYMLGVTADPQYGYVPMLAVDRHFAVAKDFNARGMIHSYEGVLVLGGAPSNMVSWKPKGDEEEMLWLRNGGQYGPNNTFAVRVSMAYGWDYGAIAANQFQVYGGINKPSDTTASAVNIGSLSRPFDNIYGTNIIGTTMTARNTLYTPNINQTNEAPVGTPININSDTVINGNLTVTGAINGTGGGGGTGNGATVYRGISFTDSNGDGQLTFPDAPLANVPFVTLTVIDPNAQPILAVLTGVTTSGFTFKTVMANAPHVHKFATLGQTEDYTKPSVNAENEHVHPIGLQTSNASSQHTHSLTFGSPSGYNTSSALGSHDHTYTSFTVGNTTGSNGDHNHSITNGTTQQYQTTNVSSHTHGYYSWVAATSTNNGGSHTHSVSLGTPSGYYTGSEDLSHSHTYTSFTTPSETGSATDNHYHTYAGYTGSTSQNLGGNAVSHTHTLSGLPLYVRILNMNLQGGTSVATGWIYANATASQQDFYTDQATTGSYGVGMPNIGVNWIAVV